MNDNHSFKLNLIFCERSGTQKSQPVILINELTNDFIPFTPCLSLIVPGR